jgi:hypothetical protein
MYIYICVYVCGSQEQVIQFKRLHSCNGRSPLYYTIEEQNRAHIYLGPRKEEEVEEEDDTALKRRPVGVSTVL